MIHLENNSLSNRIFLSTTYSEINLAYNQISSIILQNNPNLISLNLSKNSLNEYYSLTISNKKLKILDLSFNQLKSFDWSILNENLISLNLSSNFLNKISLNYFPKSLISLDLSSNQLKTLEKNAFFSKLNYLNLQNNPFDCNCHLQWLENHLKNFNICSSFDFQCYLMPRVNSFHIIYTLENTLFLEWKILDYYQTIYYLQITLEQPYRISQKIYSNQTNGIISENIQFNQHYHICLILIHKYARDRYCRDFLTKNPVRNQLKYQDKNEILFDYPSIETTTIKENNLNDKHFYLLLIGSCIGGLLTFLLLLTCCYLCYQIKSYKNQINFNSKPIYEKCSQQFHYPLYHHHHQIIYNSENLSNSTDSTQMDTSLSTTNNNHSKHIYQTIDSQDYCSLKRQHQQLFHLWNQSIKQNR